jgi:hypothetical protein
MMMDGVLPETNHTFFPNDARKNHTRARVPAQVIYSIKFCRKVAPGEQITSANQYKHATLTILRSGPLSKFICKALPLVGPVETIPNGEFYGSLASECLACLI